MESLPDERRWVARFQAGDSAAFEKIMSHYEPYVLNLLWRMTGDRARAEDLCQETFIRVLKGLPRFRSESGLKTWIFRIAQNAGADLFRTADPRTEPLEEESGPRSHSDPAESLERDQLRARVERAMAVLPPLPRAVLHLFYWDDLSITEIGSVLGLPEGTVKTHLFRGRRALRESALGLVPGGAA